MASEASRSKPRPFDDSTVVARGRRKAGWGRWRTAGLFLVRSLRLRGSSFLLALLAVTVGATITATMLNIRADLGAKMSKELRRFGPNLLVTPRPAARAFGGAAATIDHARSRALSDLLASWSKTHEPVVLCPFLIAAGTVGAPTSAVGPGSAASMIEAGPGRGSAASVIGADLETLRVLYPNWRLEGTWPVTADSSSCVAGSSLAARAGLEPGGTALVRIGAHTVVLRVAGTVSTGEAEDEVLFLSLPRLQQLTGLGEAISLLALAVDGGAAAVEEAGAAIEAAHSDLSAHPLRQVAAAQGALLGKLRRMMVLLTLVVLALSGICLVTTLMTIVVERESEIGLMRSIGAPDGEILAMFLGEVGLLGVVGGLTGLGLGALAARWIGTRLFEAPIDPRAGAIPLVLAVSLALCLASALIPLRRALAVQPAAALRSQ